MGFFDADNGSLISRKTSSSHHKKHRSRSRSPKRPSLTRQFFGLDSSHSHKRSSSRDRRDKHRSSSGIFGGDSHHHKHNSSRASFFSLPNVSTRSFFGGSKPSYYKRSPRANFMTRAYKKLKRLLRDLVYYAKKHPLKVLTLVLMPLITGGALTALLARFGLRMPKGLERMLGMGAKAVSGDGIGLVGEAARMMGGLGGGGNASVRVERGRGDGMSWERKSVERDGGWGGGLGGLAGGLASGMGGGALGSIAKMF